MKQLFFKGKKVLSFFFNTRAAGLYILLFAFSIGLATFIENDFGTSSAQKLVFKAWWFELLLVLFGITILVNIVKFRMVQQKKWTLFTFHTAIIVILIGSGITRYFGYEGTMHIRENTIANSFLSHETYLKFKVQRGDQVYDFDEPVLFASLGNNRLHQQYLVGEDLIDVQVNDFIPNPVEVMTEDADGRPSIKIVMAGVNGREEYFLREGDTKPIGNLYFHFGENPVRDAINIKYQHDSLWMMPQRNLTQMVMATQERDTLTRLNFYYPLKLRSLYSDGDNNFVVAEFHKSGKLNIQSADPKVNRESITALQMSVAVNGQTRETLIYGLPGSPGRDEIMQFGNLSVSVAYGAKEIRLPFAIRLYDFIMDRYPGTNSAASYASEVQLIDNREDIQRDFRIYMNNILNYDGYRFFQSSFDRDEQGTYLSVNHDYWGSLISYLGYGLLTLGMIFVFFSKNTRFHQVTKLLKNVRASQVAGMLLLAGLAWSTPVISQTEDLHLHHVVSPEHAAAFSRITVQDFRGRMKPMHSLSREILRKVSRKETWYGLTPDQIILSMFVANQEWYDKPVVKLGNHQKLQNLIGKQDKYAAYKDFFNLDGNYKLTGEVQRVYGLEQADRGIYEKELLKVDERINILNMVFTGSLLKIIPDPNDENQTWLANYHGHQHENSGMVENFFNDYRASLMDATATGDYRHATHMLDDLKSFQIRHGGEIIPSAAKINAEIILNNLNVFNRLAVYYILLGLVLLSALFISVFKPGLKMKRIHLVLVSLVGLGFLFHTAGLGIRWYVSGRAPWSNGYESMIYIAWTATLAGVIFSRKSIGGLAATTVLAAVILFVATLSFLDPEITPLVPVLRSYWLTIHVSMEAGSYGFLMLGAIIGLINLILMAFVKNTNKHRIKSIVQEMSYLSELTLIGGLFMVSIGTYLGGVWANESWGRYWGWDAKETWALVTILVYAFILHMRIIPKLTGLFAYNVATIFGLASVIMTYYGVNYYLSGLHSYATGDPVPIPTWVYILVACIVVISSLAYYKKWRYKFIS